MNPTTPVPTGRREEIDGTTYVVLQRELRAPIEDVWASITEPARLERWIGTWEGDPASGSVEFRMTAEGDDVPVETYRILACEPPRRLVTESSTADDPTVWRIEVDLAEDAGVTTLIMRQRHEDAVPVDSVGPGWEYYLDRLAAAVAGGDVAAIAWDDYYPAQSEHYRARFA